MFNVSHLPHQGRDSPEKHTKLKEWDGEEGVCCFSSMFSTNGTRNSDQAETEGKIRNKKNKSRTLFIPKLTGKPEISSFQHCSVPFWQLQHKDPAQRQQGWKQSRHALPPAQSQAQGVKPTLQIQLRSSFCLNNMARRIYYSGKLTLTKANLISCSC